MKAINGINEEAFRRGMKRRLTSDEDRQWLDGGVCFFVGREDKMSVRVCVCASPGVKNPVAIEARDVGRRLDSLLFYEGEDKKQLTPASNNCWRSESHASG